jgi:hypothetical protein
LANKLTAVGIASSGQTKPERKIKGTDDGIKIKKQLSLVLQIAGNICPKNAIESKKGTKNNNRFKIL